MKSLTMTLRLGGVPGFRETEAGEEREDSFLFLSDSTL